MVKFLYNDICDKIYIYIELENIEIHIYTVETVEIITDEFTNWTDIKSFSKKGPNEKNVLVKKKNSISLVNIAAWLDIHDKSENCNTKCFP